MIPTIAQSLPPPDKDFTWQAILLAAVVLSALAAIAGIWTAIRGSRSTISPQPLKVQAAEEYASKQSVDDLGRRVDANHREIQRQIVTLDETRRTSVGKVYEFTRKELESARKEQREDIARLRQDMREDMRGINDRLNDISEALGGARGELKRVPGQNT